jgi:formylglycine-generating enzyme required for sulfatase activity
MLVHLSGGRYGHRSLEPEPDMHSRFVSLTLLLLTTGALAAPPPKITHASSCKANFKGGSGPCEACVKGGGTYTKTRGSYSCVTGSGGSGGGEGGRWVAISGLPPVKPIPPPPPPKAMPGYHKEYVTVKAGEFQMGSPDDESGRSSSEPLRKVTITRNFAIKATEVSQAEWHLIMGKPTTSFDKACGHDCPATWMSWADLLAYLNKLSKKEGLEECYAITQDSYRWVKGLDCTGYRLPTEAEWEYAARAGATGPTYAEPAQIGWFDANANSTMHPVKKKKPNAWGLYDVLGNAAEWTWDVKESIDSDEAVTDPIVGGLEARTDENRIYKGGNIGTTTPRFAEREGYANTGGQYIGFRPVRTLP